MIWAAARGFRSSDSREAGPPPRTSSPAAIPFSERNTVQPVPAAGFSACPIRMPFISVMRISFFIIIPVRSFPVFYGSLKFPEIPDISVFQYSISAGPSQWKSESAAEGFRKNSRPVALKNFLFFSKKCLHSVFGCATLLDV